METTIRSTPLARGHMIHQLSHVISSLAAKSVIIVRLISARGPLASPSASRSSPQRTEHRSGVFLKQATGGCYVSITRHTVTATGTGTGRAGFPVWSRRRRVRWLRRQRRQRTSDAGRRHGAGERSGGGRLEVPGHRLTRRAALAQGVARGHRRWLTAEPRRDDLGGRVAHLERHHTGGDHDKTCR